MKQNQHSEDRYETSFNGNLRSLYAYLHEQYEEIHKVYEEVEKLIKYIKGDQNLLFVGWLECYCIRRKK